MRRSITRILVALFCLILLPHASFGQGHGYGRQRADRENERVYSPVANVRIVFSNRDRQLIRDYFRDSYSNLPPGLAKRGGNLPPGLQKHLERDGTLPPGLQKRLTPFPADLERRLPRLPDIYVRATIGSDVIILNRRTQRIIDIIHDIVRP